MCIRDRLCCIYRKKPQKSVYNWTPVRFKPMWIKGQLYIQFTPHSRKPVVLTFSSFIFLKDFIYLFDRQRSQVDRDTSREREGEAGFPLSREPDVGLDPRTLRSCPELKTEALTHWATQAPLQNKFCLQICLSPRGLEETKETVKFFYLFVIPALKNST